MITNASWENNSHQNIIITYFKSSVHFMPNPDNNILKEINRIFDDFLWEGTEKIKHTVIVKQYIEGGLKFEDYFVITKID